MAKDQTAVAMGQPEPAIGMPVPQVGLVKQGFVTIPLCVVAEGGGLHVQENAHTLQNAISRAELDAIVAELNATCERHAPCMPAYTALRVLVPIVGSSIAPSMMERKMGALKGELSATCSRIGQRGAKRDINLRVVDEPSAQPAPRSACTLGACPWARCRRLREAFYHASVPHFRIDVEVAV